MKTSKAIAIVSLTVVILLIMRSNIVTLVSGGLFIVLAAINRKASPKISCGLASLGISFALSVVLLWNPSVKTQVAMLEADLPTILDKARNLTESGNIGNQGLKGVKTICVLSKPNVLVVEFHTGGGFPVKHSGILFTTNQSWIQIQKRWPYLREVKPNWYVFRD